MKIKPWIQEAENALKFYKGIKGKNKAESNAFRKEFERLESITSKQKNEEKLQVSDICKFFLRFLKSFFELFIFAIYL